MKLLFMELVNVIRAILRKDTYMKHICLRCYKRSNEQEGLFCPRCNDALDRVMGKIN